jgi:putative thioredoxin
MLKLPFRLVRAFSVAGGGARRAPGGGAPPPPPPKMIFDASGRAIPVGAGPRAPAAAAAAAARGGAPPAPASSLPAVIDATEANFEASILRSPVAVVLHATAGWSEPCKKLAPRLEAVARAARGALVYARLDVDAQPNLATQLAVRTLPAVWGLVRGRAVDQLQGLPSEERLRQFLEALIAAAEEAGAMPAPGAGEAGDDGLAAVESVLAGAAGDVARGECARARAALEPLLRTLAEAEAGFRARAAAAAPAPAPAPAAAAPAAGSAAAMEAAALAKRRAAAAAKASPVPREVQDLGARALGMLGAWQRRALLPARRPPALETHTRTHTRTTHH